ncbi:MAG: hypothetical protein BZ138_07280 [Methanosphaera sp. rholeuAM270]|nr:MAG: hypothetical protein BZ138_07280 [Methanosphaera sp. rholeuAM270]
MAKSQTLYKTDILIEKQPIGWAKEISFDIDYGNEQEPTHTGRMVHNSKFPGCEIQITKLTKFESVEENVFLDTIDKLAEEGGTVTMITKEPLGTLVINAYRCRPDSENWSNNADEFLEIELTLQGESWDREFRS